MSVTVAHAEPSIAGVGDYIELMKPRVMSLVVFTALVGLVRAPVPMHPVMAFTALLCIAVGAGAAETRGQILRYTLVLAPVGVAPWLLGYAGPLYGVAAALAGGAMVALAIRVRGETRGHAASKQMFGFSILYLFLLFAMLLVDRMAAGFAPLGGHITTGG